MNLQEHQDEPTNGELNQRVELGNHQIGYRHKCPNCNCQDTEFIHNNYWICHSCIIWFTTKDVAGYYDVQAYEQDERIPKELLLEKGGKICSPNNIMRH